MDGSQGVHTGAGIDFEETFAPVTHLDSIWSLLHIGATNTHITISDKFQPVPDPSNHPCHIHTTSEIPRTKFPHLSSVVINSWPWTLPIVQVLSLVSLQPCLPTFLFMYALLCSPSHFITPNPHTFHTP